MAEVPQGKTAPFPVYSAQNRYTGIRQSPTGISNKPASILNETWSGDRRDTDPSQEVRGMPPNFGEGALPHVITFQGIVSSVARVYRPSDEAIKDSYDNARFMRNSPDVMECVENRQRSTALLDWHLEPDDASDPTHVQLCEDMTAIVEQIPRFMQMRENLLHALWYGRYATQFRYRWKKVRGNMRLVIDRWLPVNGDKLVFRYDDGTMEHNPDQIGVRVGAGFTTGNSVAKQWHVERINKVEPTDYGLAYFFETWERSLLAIHRHMIEDGEYEDPRSAGKIHGVGIRSRIYWAWYQKQETLAFMMEFLERSATGIEIWYYPWGNPEAEAATRKAAEERIGQGRNIILVPRPLGEEGMSYGVERIEPSMAGVDALQHVVSDYFGHMIKRYILGQTLTTEAESTGLGSNLASVHLDTFLQIVKYDATNLEETLTTDLIEPLKRYNFPKYADIPVAFRIDTESPDVEGKLKAWREAYDMGVKFKSQDVMDLIGATKPDDTDETLQSPEHQQAQMQIEAQKQQAAAMQQQAAAAQQTQVAMPSNPEADELWKNLQAQKIYDQLAVKGMTDDQFAADGVPRSENAEREKLGTYSKKESWNEGDHPRNEEGEFTEGGEGGAVATAEAPKPKVTKLPKDLSNLTGPKNNSLIEGLRKLSTQQLRKLQDAVDNQGAFDETERRSLGHIRSLLDYAIRAKSFREPSMGEAASTETINSLLERTGSRIRLKDKTAKPPIPAAPPQEPKQPSTPAAKEEGEKSKAGGDFTSSLFQRSGDQFKNLQRALGFQRPVIGQQGAKRIEKALAKHPAGGVIKALLDVSGSETGYDENGFPERGGDAFRDAIDGKFSQAELDATAAWLQDTFKNSQPLANVKQNRWIRGAVQTAKPSSPAPAAKEEGGKPKKTTKDIAAQARKEARQRDKTKTDETRRLAKEDPSYINSSHKRSKGDLEPHEMTLEKWADHYGASEADVMQRGESSNETANEAYREHEDWITKALRHKRSVPSEVLEQYPGLATVKAQPVKHSRLAQQFAREFASRDKYIVERGEGYASCYAKGWEEGKHPRAEGGEFAEKEGGGGEHAENTSTAESRPKTTIREVKSWAKVGSGVEGLHGWAARKNSPLLDVVTDESARMLCEARVQFRPAMTTEGGVGCMKLGDIGPVVNYSVNNMRVALHELGHAAVKPYTHNDRLVELQEIIDGAYEAASKEADSYYFHIDMKHPQETWADLFRIHNDPREYLFFRNGMPETAREVARTLGKSKFDIPLSQKMQNYVRDITANGWLSHPEQYERHGITRAENDAIENLLGPRGRLTKAEIKSYPDRIRQVEAIFNK